MIIPEYFACLDGPESLSGLDLVEPDVEFLIALPGREVSGRGTEDLGAYIAGRPAVGRRHRVLHAVADGDLEMVYGQVIEGDGVGTGSFVSVGLVSPAGRLARYTSFFHPEFGMYPLPAAAVVTP